MSRSSRSNARSVQSNVNADSTLSESDTTRTFDNTSADVDSSSTFLNSVLSSTGTESFAGSKVTKHEIERKQLLHDLELLRIELSQKNLIIDNLKVEHLGKVDELEENLSDARHDKQILQARLESQLKLQQDESKGRLERMRREVNSVMNRMQQLERYNSELQEKAGDVRRSLDELELSEEKYIDLKSTDVEQLSLKEFVMVGHLFCCWKLNRIIYTTPLHTHTHTHTRAHTHTRTHARTHTHTGCHITFTNKFSVSYTTPQKDDREYQGS